MALNNFINIVKAGIKCVIIRVNSYIKIINVWKNNSHAYILNKIDPYGTPTQTSLYFTKLSILFLRWFLTLKQAVKSLNDFKWKLQALSLISH